MLERSRPLELYPSNDRSKDPRRTTARVYPNRSAAGFSAWILEKTIPNIIFKFVNCLRRILVRAELGFSIRSRCSIPLRATCCRTPFAMTNTPHADAARTPVPNRRGVSDLDSLREDVAADSVGDGISRRPRTARRGLTPYGTAHAYQPREPVRRRRCGNAGRPISGWPGRSSRACGRGASW